MTIREAGFISDPRIQFLPALLEELRAGTIQVPRFQRPFVWDEDKQLELLRSVREGLPIGSLMIWQTRKAVSASELLGERRLPRATGDIHRYLLDGQQRAATLYAALIPLAEGEAPPMSMAYFDLEANDFIMRDAPPTEDEQHILDLRIALDSIKLRKLHRTFPDDRADLWIERCDEVSIAFKDYKVALIPIATDNLDLAVKTFERINTQGTQMGGVHMIHALSWSEGFHLLDRMEMLRRERLASIGWAEIDDERILDVCRLRLGLPLEGARGEKLATALRAQPEVLDGAVEDIARVATFLKECHVRSPKLLPYRHQLLVISSALRAAPEPDEDERGRLIAWFWGSSLTGWFDGEGSAARSRLRQSLDLIGSILRGSYKHPFGRRERRPLGPTVDPRGGRGRTFVLLLATLHPLDVNGHDIDLEPLLDGDRLDVTWMIHRDRLDSDSGSPGNRFLLPVQQIVELRRRLQDPTRYPWQSLRRIAESHAINEEARRRLLEGDERGFVDARRRELDAREQSLLDAHLRTLE